MDFGIQFKVRGDSFGGHFINGISMAESESMLKLKFVSSDKEKSEYISADGYKITAYHTNKNGVFECYTVFENHSNSVVTLEMISSLGFSLKQYKGFITRYNEKQRKIAAGIAIKKKGRPPKDYQVSKEDKVAQLRYIIDRKDAKIKTLEMENELMRDFLSLTERK